MTMVVRGLGDFRIPEAVSTLTSVRALDGAVEMIGRQISERVGSPRIVRLDRKDSCPGGRWGINLSEGKTWDADPIHCMRGRDPVQPPIVRVDVPCEDLGRLMWPDVFAEAQRVLRIALSGKPKPTDPWTLQARWTRQVMTLVSMAYEATNIQPIFMYPSEWAMRRPGIVFDDGALVPWGEYASSLTYDNRSECLVAPGQDTRVAGQSLPRRIQQWMGHQRREHYRRQRYPEDVWRKIGWSPDFRESRGVLNPGACGGSVPVPWSRAGYSAGMTQIQAAELDAQLWTPSATGLKYTRNARWPSESPQVGTPSFFNGPWITNNSPTIKALTGQSYDPWTTVGFGGRYRDGLDSAPLIPRDPCVAGGGCTRAQAESIARSYLNKPLETYMHNLFQTTSMRPELFVPYISRERESGIHGAGKIRYGNFGPSARYYVELAAQWATEIISLDFYQFISDAVLFYLRNHATYYKRKYGDAAISINAADLSDMAGAIEASKRQLLIMPARMTAQILGLVNPIAGAMASMVGDIMQGVLDWISNILTTQDLPKSLMRRLPIHEACEFDTSDQIGRAALVIVDSARGTGGDENDPGRSGGVSPLLVFGGYTLLGAGAWFYFKNR